jgi:superfamily II DNA or RNA helicase
MDKKMKRVTLQDYINLKCLVCGGTFERQIRTLLKKKGKCPHCADKWTKEKIFFFISSILEKEHYKNFDQSQLYTIASARGMLEGEKKGEIKKFLSRLPNICKNELESYINGEKSVKDILKNNSEDDNSIFNSTSSHVNANTILKSVDKYCKVTLSEVSEYLVVNTINRLWSEVFKNEEKAIKQIIHFSEDKYSDEIKKIFLKEYDEVKNLSLPVGYSFNPAKSDIICRPNLMQKLVAIRLKNDRHVGNWSCTGSGKTLSAILASRIVSSEFTLVLCPCNVTDQWTKEIVNTFPGSNVSVNLEGINPKNKHKYLVWGYESVLQQKNITREIIKLTKLYQIDFVVIDETHYTKLRSGEVSKRRKEITKMFSKLRAQNLNPYILGMTATPVINNLREGISILEMITGKNLSDEVKGAPTVEKCMRLHHLLTMNGIRYIPENIKHSRISTPTIDCSSEICKRIKDNFELKGKYHPSMVDNILTESKIPLIVDNIKDKTIIFTNYTSDGKILEKLRDALAEKGFSTGFYAGKSNKSGLEPFINGSLNVLICSSVIRTGIDGLQHVCRRMIINSLPWTAADFRQLIGRICRTGQKRDVEIIIPIANVRINKNIWSPCQHRWNIISYKKSIADAAVDGIIPDSNIITEEKAKKDLENLIRRILKGEDISYNKEKIRELLEEDTENYSINKKTIRSPSEFRNIGRKWSKTDSNKTHENLEKDPEDWHTYHEELDRIRKEWLTDPVNELISYYGNINRQLEIGDLGCGRAKLAEKLSAKHTVHSFDHIAENDTIISCDVTSTPLKDNQLDICIFCLSMMGSNTTDYFYEAHRILRLGGTLHIIEASNRFSDINQFKADLRRFGFSNTEVVPMSERFLHISAIKREVKIEDSLSIAFKYKTTSEEQAVAA